MSKAVQEREAPVGLYSMSLSYRCDFLVMTSLIDFVTV